MHHSYIIGLIVFLPFQNSTNRYFTNWTYFKTIHQLVLNANSLINEERRRKFSAAVYGSGFVVACVTKPGFIQISLKNFFSDIMSFIELIGPLENIPSHGGFFIAVSKSLSSEKTEHNLPKCRVAAEVTINNDKLIICAFYNPPKESVYRYTISDFKLL